MIACSRMVSWLVYSEASSITDSWGSASPLPESSSESSSESEEPLLSVSSDSILIFMTGYQ